MRLGWVSCGLGNRNWRRFQCRERIAQLKDRVRRGVPLPTESRVMKFEFDDA